MAKIKQKEYTVHVKRDVLFEAKVKADTVEGALELAKSMSIEALWKTPGDVIDDTHRITAVFE
jgi:hypothetical protein